MARSESPAFLIPPTSPWIEEYREAFEFMQLPENNTLILTTPPAAVDGMQVSMVQEIVAALQHYPSMIEKMLFSIELKFEEIEDTELYIVEDEWKTNTKYHAWFHKLFDLPVSLFFIRDRDCRFYMLTGDMLAQQEVSTEPIEGSKAQVVSFSSEQAQQIHNRLFQSCWLFYVYCYKSGVDPEVSIEAILADLDSPITYAEVQKYAEEQLDSGIQFSVTVDPNLR